MSIYPSILEYSDKQLNRKLLFLKQNKKEILNFILKQQHPDLYPISHLNLHLDFIGKDFAKDRKVMKSLSLETVFLELQKIFAKTKLNLTIHLMNELEDYKLDFEFLKNYKQNKNWNYIFYVNFNYTTIYKNLAPYAEIGVWLDCDKWQNFDFKKNKINDYLLMTVRAGVSGQLKKENSTAQITELAIRNSKKNFLLDGGWQVDEIQKIQKKENSTNLNFVSYTSFWNKLYSIFPN